MSSSVSCIRRTELKHMADRPLLEETAVRKQARLELLRAAKGLAYTQKYCFPTLRKEHLMSLMKSIFAALLLVAIVGVVPQANAQTAKVVLSGSSWEWQTIALAAYKNGTCPAGATAPCKHATYAGVHLNDTRNAAIPTGETGNLWVVWDSAATTNYWAYLTVDSIVGVRCYMAHPRCNIGNGAGGLGAIQNKISAAIWGSRHGSRNRQPSGVR